MKRNLNRLRPAAVLAVAALAAASLVPLSAVPAHADDETPPAPADGDSPPRDPVFSPPREQIAGAPEPVQTRNQPSLADGDALVTNHSFEEELSGWTASDGYGAAAGDTCADVLSTTDEWSSDGAAALQIDVDRSCRQAGAISDVVEIEPERSYTIWADVNTSRIAWLGLHWVNADEQVIDAEHTGRDVRSDRLKLSADAPEGAVGVRVEIGAIGELHADNVLLSAQYTELGAQVVQRPQIFSSNVGVDENGRDVVWGMATGSEDDPGILTATDVLTGEVTRTVRLPGVTGGWSVNQNPVTGTVYVGTYGEAGLWLYTPGDDEAVNAGKPDIPQWNFAYDVAFDEDGNAYGGGWGEPADGYPGASVYTFTEREGFTGVLGDVPLTEEANYSRALGYDEVSRTVYVGTGTEANLFACSIDTDECEDLTSLLDEEIQDSQWVYNMRAGSGYVMAWAGDSTSTGNDWLVLLDVDRNDSGELQVEVVDEIRGVAFPGSSAVADDHIYYTKAGFEGWPLFSYNVVTGEETRLGVDGQILPRHWDVVELDDPQWPGKTLVGLNSYGFLTRYNVETGNITTEQVDGVPDVAIRVNSLATGPDGSIWSAGYLSGGIGSVATMRDDEQESFNLGGQAEQMITHEGRVHQGNYPGGTIESFTAEELRNDEYPRLECEIGANQNRPYALHSSGGPLYYGSKAGYGHDLGAFGWLNTETGQCNTLEGPIGHQSIDTLTGSRDRVFGGGSIFYSWDGLPLQREATVMVFDETTGEVDEIGLPVPDLRAVSAAATDDEGTVWFYAEGWLLAMDPETLEWVHTEEIFPNHKPGERIPGYYAEMRTADDGRIYGNAGGRVFGFDPAGSLDGGSAEPNLDVLYDGAGPYLSLDDYGNIYTRHQATGLMRIVPGDE